MAVRSVFGQPFKIYFLRVGVDCVVDFLRSSNNFFTIGYTTGAYLIAVFTKLPIFIIVPPSAVQLLFIIPQLVVNKTYYFINTLIPCTMFQMKAIK